MSKAKKNPHSKLSLDTVVWEELVAHEPALNDLLIEAHSIKDEGGPFFCKDETYRFGYKNHASFKKRIDQLVGFYAKKHRDSFLSTSAAWNTTLDVILEVLPRCRKCCCVYADGTFTD